MLRGTDAFLAKQSLLRLTFLALLITALVGVLDYLTGYEISVSIFYLIPVGMGAWYVRGRLGVFICIVAAATWLVLDFTSGQPFSHLGIHIWNSGIRLIIYVIIALLLERLRGTLIVQQELAQTDGLTGILNARAFKQRCGALFKLAARYKRPLALGYFDLDGFKGINDRFGHTVGDQVLKAVAATLTQRLRASDICARLGGDEFGVLLPETDDTGARVFFTGLHESLLQLAVLNQWPVGFSIGVAVFHGPVVNPDEAIRCADDLMYQVKNTCRNNVRVEAFGEVSPGA